MVDYLSNFSKNILHQVIDLTFPLTDEIALVSAGAGWYAHSYGMTYSQGFFASQLNPSNSLFGHFMAPLFVPSASSKVSEYAGLGVYLGTCFTLNMIARTFFNIKANKNAPHLLPTALEKIGIDISPEAKIVHFEEKKSEILTSNKQSNPPKKASDEMTFSDPALTEINVKQLSKDAKKSSEDESIVFSDDDEFTNSDFFGEKDPVARGCCSWNWC